MEVEVEFDLVRAGNSVLARAKDAKLAALGSYNEEAITALTRGVQAWCLGLRRAGILAATLDRRGIEWKGDVEGDLRVTPRVTQSPPTASAIS